MKKRAACFLLLCLLMALGVLSATASAAGGQDIYLYNPQSDSTGEGWSYEHSTKTLTLRDFHGTKGISFYVPTADGEAPARIVVEGSNTLTVSSSTDAAGVTAIDAVSDMELSGSGSLTICASSPDRSYVQGIDCRGKLVIRDSVELSITAVGSGSVYGIYTSGGLEITGSGDLNIQASGAGEGKVYGIYASRGLETTGSGDLNIQASGAGKKEVYGIYASRGFETTGSGDLNIQVSGAGEKVYGIHNCSEGDILLGGTGAKTVTIEQGGTGSCGIGNAAYGGIAVADGSLTVNLPEKAGNGLFAACAGIVRYAIITLSGAQVEINGGDTGVLGEASVIIKDHSVLSITGTASNGIYSEEGRVDIIDSTVTIHAAEGYGIRVNYFYSARGLCVYGRSVVEILTNGSYAVTDSQPGYGDNSQASVIDLAAGGSVTVSSGKNDDRAFCGYIRLGENTSLVMGKADEKYTYISDIETVRYWQDTSTAPYLLKFEGIYPNPKPDGAWVTVDGGKDFGSQSYYKNGDEAGRFTGSAEDYNACYDPATGVLTLKDYDGGAIASGGDEAADLTVDLVGSSVIRTEDRGLWSGNGGHLTVTSGCGGALRIQAVPGDTTFYGISTQSSRGTGRVTITGSADVTIDAQPGEAFTAKGAYGIYAPEWVKVSGQASLSVTLGGKTYNSAGIYASRHNIYIDTTGEVRLDTSATPQCYALKAAAKGMIRFWNAKLIELRYDSGENKTFYGAYPNYSTSGMFKRESISRGITIFKAKENARLLSLENALDAFGDTGNYYLPGETVELTALPIGEAAVARWETSAGTTPTATGPRTAVFTMPATETTVTVTAVYELFASPPVWTPVSNSEGVLSVKLNAKLPESDGRTFRIETQSGKVLFNMGSDVITGDSAPYTYTWTMSATELPTGYYKLNINIIDKCISSLFYVDYDPENTAVFVVDIRLKEPVAGEQWTDASYAAAAPEGTFYTAETVGWNGTMSSNGSFLRGNVYQADCRILAAEGHYFADMPVVLVNGQILDQEFWWAEDSNVLRLNPKFTGVSTSNGVTVQGTLKNFGSATEEMSVELFRKGESTPAYRVTIPGGSAGYSIADVQPGTYTLRVSQAGYGSYEAALTVGEGDVVWDVTVGPAGDVNGDGVVDGMDAVAILRAVAGLDAESFLSAAADINGDGVVDGMDAVAILRKVAGLES